MMIRSVHFFCNTNNCVNYAYKSYPVYIIDVNILLASEISLYIILKWSYLSFQWLLFLCFICALD